MWSFVWGNPSALVCCKTSLLWTWCWILPDEFGLEAFVSDLCSLDIVTFGDKPSRILASSLIQLVLLDWFVTKDRLGLLLGFIAVRKAALENDEKYLVCDFLDYFFLFILFFLIGSVIKLHPLLKRFVFFFSFFFFLMDLRGGQFGHKNSRYNAFMLHVTCGNKRKDPFSHVQCIFI